jgi:hypothetical protein
MRELGRKGGNATFERYGREHMAAIGRKGFAALASFARGGRKAALGRLAASGKLARRWPELSEKQTAELYEDVGIPF